MPKLILKKENIEFTIECQEEDSRVRGSFATGEDERDKAIEDDILERLESNPWAWCCICVKGSFRNLEATDYLGQCSYYNEQDFIKNSGYYEDMCNTVMEDLQSQVNDIVSLATCE